MEANIVEMVTLVVKGEMISLTLWGTAMQRHLSRVMKAVMKLLILGKDVLNIVTLFLVPCLVCQLLFRVHTS